MHEEKLAQGMKTARRQFCTKGQFCTSKNFFTSEILHGTEGHFCTRVKKTVLFIKEKLKGK